MTATPEGLDLRRITDALARHNVEYLLVGGMASRAHGAQRRTYDVDCVPEPSWENLDRLAAAMRDLGARLRVEGLSDEEAALLPVQLTGSTLVRMEISIWRTDAGDLDILADIPDRDGRHMPYAELIDRASELHLDRRDGGARRGARRPDRKQGVGGPPQGSRRPTRTPLAARGVDQGLRLHRDQRVDHQEHFLLRAAHMAR